MGLLIVAALWFFAFVGTPIIASNKNRSAGWWFVAALVIGIFAFALVLLLPALPDYEALRAERARTKTCPSCLSSIPLQASVCRYCQRDVPAPSAHLATEAPPIEQGGIIAGHPIDCACSLCVNRRALRARQAQKDQPVI